MVLVNLTVAMALVNYFWLRLNQCPPVDDEAYHLLSALKYFWLFGNPSSGMFGSLLFVDDLYPPLFPFLAAWGAHIFGAVGTVSFCMTNAIFLVVTFFSLYGIGLKMGDRRLGVLASCFLALYPMFFHLSRMFMLEIALVGMVTLTVMLLLYSEGFTRTVWSVLAGISLGLGMLTKQTCVVFVVGPALWGLLGSWNALDAKQKKRKVVNFCLFVALGIAIALPWYFADGATKCLNMRGAFLVKDKVDFNFFASHLGALVFYLRVLVLDQMGWIFFGGFVLAIFTKFRKLFESSLLFVWFAVPYAVFLLFPNKYYYYTLASLPAVALMSAGGLLSVKKAVVRWVIISGLLLLGVGQFIQLSFLSPQIPSKILSFARFSPQTGNHQIQTLFRRITEESNVEKPVIGVPSVNPNTFSGAKDTKIGRNYVCVNWDTLKYQAALDLKPWTIKTINGLNEDDFTTPPHFIVCHERIEKLGFPASFSASYRPTDIFVMPDTTRVYLYKLEEGRGFGGRKAVVHQDENSTVLDNGLLQLGLEDNRWRLYWKGQSIVKRLSVLAAFKPFRIWNNSRECFWRILSRDKNRLVARAYFCFLIPAQEWEFVLDGNRVYWTVKVFEPFIIKSEWEEVRVLLVDEYRHWITALGSGDFPRGSVEGFMENWLPSSSGGGVDSGYVGVEQVEDHLPAVTFYSLRSRNGLKGEVGSVEGYMHGKLLKYVFRWPWRYDYFRGCLLVGDKSFNSRWRPGLEKE